MVQPRGRGAFPAGIVPVVQTPFDERGAVDLDGVESLVDDAIEAGADGLLVPAVASEVAALSARERELIVRAVAGVATGRVPLVVGAAADDVPDCRAGARLAEAVGAAGYLVAVPQALAGGPAEAVRFVVRASDGCPLPLMVQDLDWRGPGLPLEIYEELVRRLPSLAGVKIETVPAGPKYSAVTERFGDALYVCGGWAVTQLVEALDRGVDGMVPECSMVRVYRAVVDAHARGDRAGAVRTFRRLLPVLAFSNQDLYTSVAFFKRLLQRKGIIACAAVRLPGYAWDLHTRRIADELIELYLELEGELA